MINIVKKGLKYILVALLFILIGQITYWATHTEKSPSWTGFGEKQLQENYQYAKSLWDWLELVLIPFILVLGAWYLGQIEKDIEAKREVEKNQQTSRLVLT